MSHQFTDSDDPSDDMNEAAIGALMSHPNYCVRGCYGDEHTDARRGHAATFSLDTIPPLMKLF